MPDAATLKRQKELEARHRDLTKPIPALGSTPESLRGQRGFEGITDEMLAERANFNLKDHMAKPPQANMDLRKMTPQELRGLAQAAASELDNREGK